MNVKQFISLVGLLAIVAAGRAFAQSGGINLAWNNCLGEGGVTDRTRACTNAGINDLYLSFVVPQDIPTCQSSEGILDVQVASQTIPSWWLDSNRWGGMAPVGGLCAAWYEPAPSGPLTSGPSIVQTAPWRLRIRFSVSVLPGEEQTVLAGQEYLSHVIRLRFNSGTSNDPGCMTPACFVANELLLQQPGTLPATRLQSPYISQHATWRGGGFILCPAAVPAKLYTWGSIKALYR
jgi:hypothetical protein